MRYSPDPIPSFSTNRNPEPSPCADVFVAMGKCEVGESNIESLRDFPGAVPSNALPYALAWESYACSNDKKGSGFPLRRE